MKNKWMAELRHKISTFSNSGNQTSSSKQWTGHLISWIWKCWNLLFQFCHLIGFHCLCGPGFSKCTVSPTPLTEYIVEGGKGNLLTSTFSKQLCNRWLEMGNDRLGPGLQWIVEWNGEIREWYPWVWLYYQVDSRYYSEGHFLSSDMISTWFCGHQG